jgi:hypothetical protein
LENLGNDDDDEEEEEEEISRASGSIRENRRSSAALEIT